MPDLPSERELDICLMKQTRRKVQRGGYLQFENLMYRGENLAGYQGEQVTLRYNPRDITTLFVYWREGNQEDFLTRAFASDLETERLSLEEAQATRRQIRDKGKTVSNRSIAEEIQDRDRFVAAKQKSKKQRQKAEQAQLATSAQFSQSSSEEVEDEITANESSDEVPDVEVFDYEEMLDNYGW